LMHEELGNVQCKSMEEPKVKLFMSL